VDFEQLVHRKHPFATLIDARVVVLWGNLSLLSRVVIVAALSPELKFAGPVRFLLAGPLYTEDPTSRTATGV